MSEESFKTSDFILLRLKERSPELSICFQSTRTDLLKLDTLATPAFLLYFPFPYRKCITVFRDVNSNA